MVRRYRDLIQEIRDRQRYTRVEWTRKVVDALLYTLEQMEPQSQAGEQQDVITYDEWRGWQESLARQFGFSETTDKPVDKSLRNRGWKKLATIEKMIAR